MSKKGSAVGYIRVSTIAQKDSGLGLEVQRQAIQATADEHNLEITHWCSDEGISGSSSNRPGLNEALDFVNSGEVDKLIVSRIDRLGRKFSDTVALMERLMKNDTPLIISNIGDLSTSQGRLVARMFLAVAETEKELIGERTRQALAVAKQNGVKLGRKITIPKEVSLRAKRLREEGMTYQEITDIFNAEDVPRGHGGKQWWPASIRETIQKVTEENDSKVA